MVRGHTNAMRWIEGLVTRIMSKKRFFFLNLLILGALVFLIAPAIDHQSVKPFILGYSKRYLLYIITLLTVVGGLAVSICVGSPRLNRSIFIYLCIVIGTLEVALRVVGPQSMWRAAVFQSPAPYVMFRAKEDSRLGYSKARLNEMGFRIDRQLLRDKRAGEFRIFVLGGSAVFHGNVDSPLAATIPGVLEKLFRESGHRNVFVYNFGAVSYVSGQELALLVHTLVDYQPDFVIVYDGYNDAAGCLPINSIPGVPFNYRGYEAMANMLQTGGLLRQWFAVLLMRSRLATRCFRNSLESHFVAPVANRDEWNIADWNQATVAAYIRNMNAMGGVARGFRFKLMVVLQPILYLKKNISSVERAHFQPEPQVRWIVSNYGQMRTKLADLFHECDKADGFTFLDLSNAFGDMSDPVFWDCVHVTDRGNQLVARQIYDHCLTKDLLGSGGSGNARQSSSGGPMDTFDTSGPSSPAMAVGNYDHIGGCQKERVLPLCWNLGPTTALGPVTFR